MASQKDHIENALNQLLAKKHQLEGEVREIEEAIGALAKVPALLEGGRPSVQAFEKSRPKFEQSQSINRGLSDKVRAYIAEYPYSEKIVVGPMIEDLERKGVKGKHSSLYAYIHSLLKKLTAAGEMGLQYTAGVGYTRERPALYPKEPDAVLVHTEGLSVSVAE